MTHALYLPERAQADTRPHDAAKLSARIRDERERMAVRKYGRFGVPVPSLDDAAAVRAADAEVRRIVLARVAESDRYTWISGTRETWAAFDARTKRAPAVVVDGDSDLWTGGPSRTKGVTHR